MKRFRSRRFAMLMILILTLSMVLQGAVTSVFAANNDDPLNTKFYENTSPGNNAPGPLSIDMTGTPEKAAYVPGETAKIIISLKNNGHGDYDGTNYDLLAVVKDAGSNIIFNQPAIDQSAVDNFNIAPGEEKTYEMYYTIPFDQTLGTLNLSYTAYDYGLFKPVRPSEVEILCDPEWMHTEIATGVIPLTIVEAGSITINKTVDPGYEGSKFVCFSLNPVLPSPEPVGNVGAEGFRPFRYQCVRIEEGSAAITFEGLPYGEYRIEETRMPRYYTTDLAEETIIISAENLHPEIAVSNIYTSPITIEKTVVPTVANIGDEVTYIFKVKNIGEYNLFHAEIKDLDIPFDAYQEPSDSITTLEYEGEYLEPGEEWMISTTHVLTAEDMTGGSFTNVAKVRAYTCEQFFEEKPDITPVAMTEADVDAACMRLCVWVEASDDATVTLPAPAPTVTTTTTTPERDRAEPAGSYIPPEVVPLGFPAYIAPAPVALPEEVIPLGVPVLPKTGELPMELFYGLGGMLTALGAYLKRR